METVCRTYALAFFVTSWSLVHAVVIRTFSYYKPDCVAGRFESSLRPMNNNIIISYHLRVESTPLREDTVETSR